MPQGIFNSALKNIGSRLTSKSLPTNILLDKNEQTDDLDPDIKNEISAELLKAPWNRYPAIDNYEIERLIANYCKVNPENIAIAPGSAYLITAFLNYFAINHKHIIIAQPSYTLFDYHCKTYNIPYEPWYLNEHLEFSFKTLPGLTANSVLIITSPNNPVGNVVEDHKLDLLLQYNKDSLIILDSVYLEFSNMDPTPLIKKYENLIILRSFSKAFPAAGLRLGYMCANEAIISTVKKLILLFSINHFSLAFAKVILSNPSYLMKMENRIQKIINERDYLFGKLSELVKTKTLKVSRSEGNFLLIKMPDTVLFTKVIGELNKNNIQVSNTSKLEMLENSFRISIGNHTENESVYNCIKKALF